MKPEHTINRRSFLLKSAGLLFVSPSVVAVRAFGKPRQPVMTVLGPIEASALGNTLIHEHILVDFIGAASISPDRWNDDTVKTKMLPYLNEAKQAGCKTLVDCTPNYLGRDALLLKELSQQSGLHILTNTGYYGGSDHKFLPAHAFTESADQLSQRWISEWKNGIDGTGVKPGFIKISVNSEHLSDVSLKLIVAAAKTHRKTGLVIASHTGPSVPAFQQIEVLRNYRVDPGAFIWVHAQNEKDWDYYIEAARKGAWVSLDGLNDENVSVYVSMLQHMKKNNSLHQTLISHDAGWYDPENPEGNIRGYTTLFTTLIPALEQEGFEESEIRQLIQHNPAKAFVVNVRKLK